jgi:phosphodiesterase/alkaline phosphatase D-like protein
VTSTDSNRPLGPGSDQYDWLDQTLGPSNARWKFVAHHLSFQMFDVEGRLRDAFELNK